MAPSPARALVRLPLVFAAALIAAAAGAARGDEFEPPPDGALAEKQVLEKIAVDRELLAATRAAETSDAPPPVRGSVAWASVLARHGLSPREYDWISGRLAEALAALEAERLFLIATRRERRKEVLLAARLAAARAAGAREQAATLEKELEALREALRAKKAAFDAGQPRPPEANLALARKHRRAILEAAGVATEEEEEEEKEHD